jgi:hypothetical protein
MAAAAAGGRACACVAQTLAHTWLVRPAAAAAAACSWARAAGSVLPSVAVLARPLARSSVLPVAAGGACGAATLGMAGALDLQNPCAPTRPCPAVPPCQRATTAEPLSERERDLVCSPVGPSRQAYEEGKEAHR